MHIYLKSAIDTVSAYKLWMEVAARSKLGHRRRTRLSTNRHVALIAWFFPPSNDVGALRPTYFVKYGTEFKWKTSVISGPDICSLNPATSYLLQHLPKLLSLARVEPFPLKPSWNWFPRINGGFLDALFTFLTALKLLDKDPPSVVMATGPPFHTFVAAYYIARFYRARLVLDYRDEWTEGTPAFVKLGNADREWESICLRKADAIIFTTQSMLELYTNSSLKVDPVKCHVIRNGWDPADFLIANEVSREFIKPERLIVIAFFGTISDHTLPGDFLKTIEKVIDRRADLRNRLKIRFVGRQSKSALTQLNSFAYQEVLEKIDNFLPKPLMIRMMQESSALLLLNGLERERVLPLKLYEYLAAEPPILVFGDKGETPEIIRKLNAGILIPIGDDNVLESALDRISNIKTFKTDRINLQEWLNLHTCKMMAQRMIQVFEQLIDGSKYESKS